MNTDNTKSSKELKREVLNQLNRVESDIDRIERGLTPGQLIDSAVFSRFRHNPRATFEHLKNNPIGTSFLTLGALLLMEDDTHRSFERISKERIAEGYQSTKHQSQDLVSVVKEKLTKKGPEIGTGMDNSYVYDGSGEGFEDPSLKEKALKGMESVKSSFSAKTDELKSKASDFKDQVSTQVSDTKESLAPKMESLKDKVTGMADTLRQQAQDKYHDLSDSEATPLAFIALGAGLGALTGASLPLFQDDESLEGLETQFGEFRTDLKNAMNQSTSSLKDGILGDLKNVNLNFF
jgi:hypothetical protein